MGRRTCLGYLPLLDKSFASLGKGWVKSISDQWIGVASKSHKGAGVF